MIRFILLLVVCAAVLGSDCNGNGMIYPDTSRCECYQCFSGVNCSVEETDCVVQLTDGTPGLYQQYWVQHRQDFTMMYPEYRTPYQPYTPYAPDINDASVPDGIHKVLVPRIQGVHKLYKNVVADGKWIVPGYGCTDLITAVGYAFSELKREESNDPVNIFAKPPYYTGYSSMTRIFPGRMNFSMQFDLDPDNVLEFNTLPNNPDGLPRTPTYPKSFVVYDNVYLWPSLTNYTEPLDADISLFSMSKLTGHAGSRFGWALVRDQKVANLMTEYLELSEFEISVETQYRSFVLLGDLLEHPNRLFTYIRGQMEKRWNEALFYLNRQPQRFKQTAVAGTFYMWVECLDSSEAVNCADVFLQVGLQGEPGSVFGSGDEFVRLEMVPHDPVFDIFMKRLDILTKQ